MATPFVFPVNREDLLSPNSPGQYYVQELLDSNIVPRRLADCNAAFHDDGFLFILNHFDALFSAVHHARDLDTRHLITSHNIVIKGMSGMSLALPRMIETMDGHMRGKLLNAAKMYLYLLYENLRSLEERFDSKTDTKLAVDAKSRKKAMKNFVDFDWDEKRNISLVKLHEFIHQPLPKLWDPPVADEDFVNTAANCCYKTLEDPQVSQVRLSHLKHSIFDILGVLIEKYGHGLSCTVKMVQLLKLYEHLPTTLAQGAVKFVIEYNSRNFVREMIREITEEATACDNFCAKACSHFLVEVAKEGPEVILPSVHMLLPELENDSYVMRNCVLGVLGEIVSALLAKEHLSEDLKKTRNIFFEHLEEHLIDTNGSVRSKVLKIWERLCEEKAIPLARLSQLLEQVVDRLQDVSWTVTRNAIQLYHSLLQSNPFGDKLEIEKFRQNLKEEEERLVHVQKEVNSKIPPSRAKQWQEIAPKIVLILQEDLSSGEEEKISEEFQNNSMADNIKIIFQYLEKGNYIEAIHLLRFTEKQSKAATPRADKELDWQVDYFHNLLRKIFLQYDEDGNRRKEKDLNPEHKEALERLQKQRLLTQYLKDCIVFAEQLETATDIINNLLSSAQPAVMLDAIKFLTAAYQFGLKGALVGVQNMLMLVWSSESSIKDGVAAAYRSIYIEIASHAPGRSRAGEIVRNLSHLLKTLNESQQAAVEVLVHEWVKNGDMDRECIQILWERYSMKLPDTTEDDSRAALILLGMAGGASQSIIKNNIPVLVSVGLGERGHKDYRLVKETCSALLKLVPETTLVSSDEEAFVLNEDHEMFQNLCLILTNGYCTINEQDYLSMALEALDVIYKLSEHPDKTCVVLLNKFSELTKKAVTPGNFDDLMNPSDLDRSKALGPVPSSLLERFVAFIGHIAFRQWIHLDRKVFRELKRRNTIREAEAEKKRNDSHKNKNKDKRKSQANLNSSILSRASETPRLKKDKNDSADAEIGEMNANEAEADYINHVCETELVTGETALAKLSTLVVSICTNPQKYSDINLQSTASISLTKLMMISSAFCEEHLALVFTMMEKSNESLIRSNLVYAVGDLANRFPNLLEPWTKHIYARLQDKSFTVRLDTIMVLRHLITNEMVKVRGQISDMALCIVDPEERIAVMASEFFRDLSKKGNTLYNVMPDIISRLSNPSMNVSEDHFHVILEFLLPLINKDKQMESLVDKLCQRFRSSTTERQWSDIAFCLSLIQYSDRSLRRLTENFQCYFDKLNTGKVYEAFESIITQALKTTKPERKVIVEELQAKIDEVMKKGLDLDGAGAGHSEDAGEGTEDNEGNNQKENRLSLKRKEKRCSDGGKRLQAGRRRGRRKPAEDSSEEGEESEDSDREVAPQPQLKARHSNRRRRR